MKEVGKEIPVERGRGEGGAKEVRHTEHVNNDHKHTINGLSRLMSRNIKIRIRALQMLPGRKRVFVKALFISLKERRVFMSMFGLFSSSFFLF